MKICIVDNQQIFKEQIEFNPLFAIPIGGVLIDAPEEIKGKFYKLENKQWVELSEYPTLPEPPVQVPQTLTPRQARLVLLEYGLLDDVERIIANNRAIQIWWEYSLEIERNNNQLIEFATIANLSEQVLDEIFIKGATL